MDRRTPPHRHNTPPNYIHRTPPGAYPVPTRSTTKDPRIPGISVFNLEQLRNPQVDQYPTRNRDDVHRKQPAAATPLETRLDHVQEMMSQILNLAQDLVEEMKKGNNRRRDRSSLRDHPKSVLHRGIPEASLLASPLIKQSETRSIEVIAPAPILQDPVRRSEVVEEVWVQQVQELQKSVADQVFDEIPQPTVKAAGAENEGRKSQKPEASQSNHSATVLGSQKVQIQKSNEFLIDSLMDDDKLEMSWCVNKVQECKIQFPVTDSTESSYFVEFDCKLDLVIVTPVAAQWFQVSRRHGEKMERIGVG